MKRLAALLLGAVFLLSAPASAITDEEFAELTTRQVALDIQVAVKRFDSLGPVWTAPYEAVVEFLDVVDGAILKVQAVTFPECLHLYRDTTLLGLALLQESIEVIGRAAGVADDADRAAFTATGPAGYQLLTVTAPSLLTVADCSEPIPADVA